MDIEVVQDLESDGKFGGADRTGAFFGVIDPVILQERNEEAFGGDPCQDVGKSGRTVGFVDDVEEQTAETFVVDLRGDGEHGNTDSEVIQKIVGWDQGVMDPVIADAGMDMPGIDDGQISCVGDIGIVVDTDRFLLGNGIDDLDFGMAVGMERAVRRPVFVKRKTVLRIFERPYLVLNVIHRAKSFRRDRESKIV